jgi:hypothetical protein
MDAFLSRLKGLLRRLRGLLRRKKAFLLEMKGISDAYLIVA